MTQTAPAPVPALAAGTAPSDVRPIDWHFAIEDMTCASCVARVVKAAGYGIRALTALRPETAHMLRGAQEVAVPLAEVRVGDVVVVRPR